MNDEHIASGQAIIELWRTVVSVWTDGLFGVDVGRYVVAIFILAGFLILRRLFTRFVLARVNRFAEESETDFDNGLLRSVERPIRFVPFVLGIFFAIEYLELSGTVAAIADRIVRSLIIFVIFWIFHSLVAPLSVVLRKLEGIFTHSMMDWLIKAIKAAFVFVGAATILETWGIQVGPIIAGLGLMGVAVALGAQDLFKNLISGILIIAERRFMRGQWIRVDGVVEGTVETIGFRSTLVRRFDMAPVYVPNSRLSDSPVINFSEMTHRRIFWTIGVRYDTTVDQLREVRDGIETYLVGNSDFANPPEALLFVHIDRFGESAIEIMLYCFTRTTQWGRWLEIKEALAYKIKDVVEGAGAGFALPGRAVYLEMLPAERPEVFVPPGTDAGDGYEGGDRPETAPAGDAA